MDILSREINQDLFRIDGPWQFQMDQDDLGIREQWFAQDFDRTAWGTVDVPRAWDFYDQALWGYEGIGWFAAQIPAGLVQANKWQRLFLRG